MATVSQWVAGARPRTLPMAVAPVLIGAAAAFSQPVSTDWFAYAPLSDITYSPGGAELGIVAVQIVVALMALGISLALQVGVNYANDYSDGVRGTDDVRVGPMRLTASGAAQATHVKYAAFTSFGVAGLLGLAIVLLTGAWWMLAVGAVCILAAWWYTGGKNPYGYLGLGEVMVFVFFGLVATLGTAYAIVEAGSTQGYAVEFPMTTALIGAVSQGLIASALLMANNVRDIPTDAEAGKRTLAVRLGEGPARWSYAGMVGVAVLLPLMLVPASPWFLLVALSWVFCAGPIRIMLRRYKQGRAKTGPQLIPVLQLTGLLGLVFATSYSAALLLSG